MTTRVLVTGSRSWIDRATLRGALDSVWFDMGFPDGLVVVHGACPTGADAMADEWALDNADLGVTVERHPADWDRYGRAAGPLRNTEMVELGAVVCLAFPLPGSRGTVHCMREARRVGIPVCQLRATGLSLPGGGS